MNKFVRYALAGLAGTVAVALTYFALLHLITDNVLQSLAWKHFLFPGVPVTLCVGPIQLFFFERRDMSHYRQFWLIVVTGWAITTGMSLWFATFAPDLYLEIAKILGMTANNLLVAGIQAVVFALPPIVAYAYALTFSNNWLKRE